MNLHDAFFHRFAIVDLDSGKKTDVRSFQQAETLTVFETKQPLSHARSRFVSVEEHTLANGKSHHVYQLELTVQPPKEKKRTYCIQKRYREFAELAVAVDPLLPAKDVLAVVCPKRWFNSSKVVGSLASH